MQWPLIVKAHMRAFPHTRRPAAGTVRGPMKLPAAASSPRLRRALLAFIPAVAYSVEVVISATKAGSYGVQAIPFRPEFMIRSGTAFRRQIRIAWLFEIAATGAGKSPNEGCTFTDVPPLGVSAAYTKIENTELLERKPRIG